MRKLFAAWQRAAATAAWQAKHPVAVTQLLPLLLLRLLPLQFN